MSYLKANKLIENENVGLFREEINDLGGHNPTIIAFGNGAHRSLSRNFMDEYKIFKIPHCSIFCSKEKYR